MCNRKIWKHPKKQTLNSNYPLRKQNSVIVTDRLKGIKCILTSQEQDCSISRSQHQHARTRSQETTICNTLQVRITRGRHSCWYQLSVVLTKTPKRSYWGRRKVHSDLQFSRFAGQWWTVPSVWGPMNTLSGNMHRGWVTQQARKPRDKKHVRLLWPTLSRPTLRGTPPVT